MHQNREEILCSTNQNHKKNFKNAEQSNSIYAHKIEDKLQTQKLETVSIAEPLQNRQHVQNP